ncbi:hypothetical protein WMF18_17170 [Sorangium sp. So ce315]|uniref:hypothetical protein n=1 Tax=Sorangium sp. So ce315 TaxID=3133299 RepID=UPI003F5F78B2
MQHDLTETQRVLVIAGLSNTDPRTVRRFLAGEDIRRPTVRERIELAQRQLAQLQSAPPPVVKS